MRQPRQRTYRKRVKSKIINYNDTVEHQNKNFTNNEKANEVIKKEDTKTKDVSSIIDRNKKDWQPKIANLIAFGALIISGILAIYTAKVFQIADSQSESVIKSANASVDAAKTAKNTLEETKQYNKRYLQLQKDMFDSNNDDSKKRSKRDSLDLDAQIQTLKTTKKQFEIENQPYLQVNKIVIDTIQINKPLQITFHLYNNGRLPARIIFIETNTGIFNKKDFHDIPRPIKLFIVKTKTYIGDQTTEKVTQRTENNLNQETIDAITKKEVYIFLIGKCEYINPVNNNCYIYNFKFKVFKDKEEDIENSVKRVFTTSGTN